MTDQTTADRHVAEARRDVHESLTLLPAWEADRVRSLIADLESAVESRTAVRMADVVMPAVLPATTNHDTDTDAAPDRRARFKAAISEADGWVLDDGQHMVDAVMAVADAELESERAISRRLLVQRQEMAEERYAWQQRGDRAEAEVERLGVDRAAVLREAADRAEIVALRLRLKHDYGAANGAYEVMEDLRRLAAECPECGTTGACNGGPCPLRRVADETAATETQAHVCKPGASTYYCPTSGETESDCHGGFDACCDRQDLHQPVAGARQDGAQQ